MKKLDLGYGNPGFLQDTWNSHSFFGKEDFKDLMPYKYGKIPNSDLVKQILNLHKKQKNVKISDKTKVILTVGASQALVAALSYFKQKKGRDIYIPSPYWSRFNDFNNLLELKKSDSKDSIRLITSPNNPDGKDQSFLNADIRDACYNWPTYTNKIIEFSDPIVLFSLSKLSGHSSTRIGWIITESDEIADYLTNHINTFTAGISIESQIQAKNIIETINNSNFFDLNSSTLNSRFLRLKEIVLSKQIPIKFLSNQGMFLYIECDPDLIKSLNIITANGHDFNDCFDNRFRLNIGVESSVFDEFLNRIEFIK